MRFCVLGSGSKGNSTFIEGGGTRVLVDAGFSGIEVERRLAAIDVDIATISALLVTHEHGDHIGGVQVLARRFGIPVFINPETKAAAGKKLEKLANWCEVKQGVDFAVENLKIHPFQVTHDSAHTLGFVVKSGDRSVGYCTDSGSVSQLMKKHLAGCSGLVLESNHDLKMLKDGDYPPFLKQRVNSREGHLSNIDAVKFLVEHLIHDGLEHVVLAHISEKNNTHKHVWRAVYEHLPEEKRRHFSISLALQDEVGEVICLNGLNH